MKCWRVSKTSYFCGLLFDIYLYLQSKIKVWCCFCSCSCCLYDFITRFRHGESLVKFNDKTVESLVMGSPLDRKVFPSRKIVGYKSFKILMFNCDET